MKTIKNILVPVDFSEDCCVAVEMAVQIAVTHGSSGLKQMLIGSGAEKVVPKATFTVLTVKHPDFKFEMI